MSINTTNDLNAILQDIGFALPSAAAPAANYVPYKLSGHHVYISGQIPFLNGETMHIGRVGETYSCEQAVEAAQCCALNILGQMDAAIDGDWSRMVQCVKLGGFVNCTHDFTAHPTVINGASDLMVAALGDQGRHTRFAVGVPSLPLGVAVEIDAVFEIKS